MKNYADDVQVQTSD